MLGNLRKCVQCCRCPGGAHGGAALERLWRLPGSYMGRAMATEDVRRTSNDEDDGGGGRAGSIASCSCPRGREMYPATSKVEGRRRLPLASTQPFHVCLCKHLGISVWLVLLVLDFQWMPHYKPGAKKCSSRTLKSLLPRAWG